MAKDWSFSFSIIPSKEHPGLISFRMDCLDLPAVQGTLQEFSPTPQFKSINSLALSFLHSPTLKSIHDHWKNQRCSVQFSSVTQSCPTLCDLMNRSTPGLPVQHQLPEFTQTHIHRVSDAIQPSHPLSPPSPLAPTPFQHQSLFQ